MRKVVGVFLAISGSFCTQAAVGQDQVPLVQKGIQIHEVEVEDVGRPVQYLVDNSRLKHKGPGVLWRLSKGLANISNRSHFVRWNSTVSGTNEGDGWVAVGDLYLPIMVNGTRVLFQKKTDTEEAAPAKAELVKYSYVPTEVRAQDDSWIRCNITGAGSQPNTYNIIVLPSTFSPYPLDNVPADRLKRVKLIRRFLPIPRKLITSLKGPEMTGEEVIMVHVEYPSGDTGTLRFLTKSPMRVMMKMACDRMNVDWTLCERAFLFRRNGKKVYEHDTVPGIDLKDSETFEMGRCKHCRACADLLCFLLACTAAKALCFWHSLLEFGGGCEHPALPGSRAGLKVIIAGLGKTGTRTMSHALNALGLRTYHSEDLCFYSFREYSQRMRGLWEYRHHLPGLLVYPLDTDARAQVELAAALSRCRVRGLALDGLERLFWPIFNMSVDAKVIVLDWRSFASWRKSCDVFTAKLILMCLFNLVVGSSSTVLPWGALLKPWDSLLGRPIHRAIREGGPPITEASGPLMFFYQQGMNHYNHYTTMFEHDLGPLLHPDTEAEYEQFYAAIRDRVPAGHRMSWDPRTNTYEDLCAFLGVARCPASGRLPKARNTWVWERDFPVSSFVAVTVRLFLHWANWRLLLGLCRCQWRRAKSS